MRLLLLCLLVCLGLTSCVYFKDLQGQTTQLNAASLSTRHNYQTPPGRANSGAWWDKFHDPQLNQLISVALMGSPDMDIAKARVRQARHLAEQTFATLWPSVDLNANVQRERFSEFGLVPPPFNGGTFNIGTIGLNFNYEFDFWGKNRQSFFAKLHEHRAAKAELAEAQLVLSTTVASVYFQLLSDIQQVEIAKTRWHLNEQLLQITTDRAKHGIEYAIPVQTMQANIQAAKLSLEQYQQAQRLTRNQLAILLGNNPFTTDFATKQFAYHSYSVALPASLPAHLLAMRPDIDAAKARVEAAANQIHVAKAQFFPDINLMALLSLQSVGLNHLFNFQSRNDAIGAALDLPIFDAGARRANYKGKYAEFDRAVSQYNQTILNALHEVADQLTMLQTISAQLKAENNALYATDRNYHLFESRYHHGISDYLQVLQSKQELTLHQATQLDLQTRYLLAVVAMTKALGGQDLIKQG